MTAHHNNITSTAPTLRTLSGHTSPETAYLVDDYPYGFRLRCKIRYWIEEKAGHGFRFVSQTTNPKRAGEVWNKPKASTYVLLAAVMLVNEENGHITWNGLTEYGDIDECERFVERYREGLSEATQQKLARWIQAKGVLKAKMDEGMSLSLAAAHAAVDYAKGAE